MINTNELAWFKSSYSGDQGSCVEVADARAATGKVMVRDSKDPYGPALAFPPEAFAALVHDAASGAYDINP